MDSVEISALLVNATLVRHKIEEMEQLSLLHPYMLIDHPYIRIKLNKIIRMSQGDGSYASAAGAMVWLHTLRLTQSPELRIIGKQIWVELSRGFQEIHNHIDQIRESVEHYIDNGNVDDYKNIPDGFQ